MFGMHDRKWRLRIVHRVVAGQSERLQLGMDQEPVVWMSLFVTDETNVNHGFFRSSYRLSDTCIAQGRPGSEIAQSKSKGAAEKVYLM